MYRRNRAKSILSCREPNRFVYFIVKYAHVTLSENAMRMLHSRAAALTIAALLCCAESGITQNTKPLLPGKLADGRVRLPNGWYLSPAGKHLAVGELPLNMDVSPDEKYIIVANNGTRVQSVSIIETNTWTVVQTVPQKRSWVGIRFIDRGTRFLVSGGNDNRVNIYNFDNGRATFADSILLGPRWPDAKIWIAGLDVDEESGRLFAAARENNALYAIDLTTKRLIHRLDLPSKPYTCRVSAKHNFVYLSLWGGSAVAFVDKQSVSVVKTVNVGDHPCDMVESPDGTRLFVANANLNTVSVIDVVRGEVVETISTALVPNAPAGSTPNAVCLSPDGKRLYVANADNNYLAVMDVSDPRESRSLGFIPVGWYPTSVRMLHKPARIIVANGKGAESAGNPHGPNPTVKGRREEYIGSLFKGTVSSIPEPSPDELQRYSLQVYQNSRYGTSSRSAPSDGSINPIPGKVGDPSPIKHVFYIIKENRTYDQVFGDISGANGDSSLCLFPDSITPNHHALARQFVLLDNFYCDAEVSADGHNWSMAAYATDYVEKSWPTSYGGRGGEYEFEGGYPWAYPSAGFIWDNCKRNNVSYRSYGEFAQNGQKPGDSTVATLESLAGHVAPWYMSWDLSYSDVKRVQAWEKEFTEYERNGGLPHFQTIKLPNDHTEGTRRGSLSPRAFVAQNDLALGMLIERITRSRFWKESAIFVIEDDAQDGPDHVDAHRTVALVISPYTKRHFVDSELYSTTSMLRTMELILGLPPLSQFDATATPMHTAFTSTPDTTGYRCRPAKINIEERNPAGSFGQGRSGEMDFTREDAAPERELNQIVWKSIRGIHSEMPPPVRSAFVRTIGGE